MYKYDSQYIKIKFLRTAGFNTKPVSGVPDFQIGQIYTRPVMDQRVRFPFILLHPNGRHSSPETPPLTAASAAGGFQEDSPVVGL